MPRSVERERGRTNERKRKWVLSPPPPPRSFARLPPAQVARDDQGGREGGREEGGSCPDLEEDRRSEWDRGEPSYSRGERGREGGTQCVDVCGGGEVYAGVRSGIIARGWAPKAGSHSERWHSCCNSQIARPKTSSLSRQIVGWMSGSPLTTDELHFMFLCAKLMGGP